MINTLNNNRDVYWRKFYGKRSNKLYKIIRATSEHFDKIKYFMAECFIKEEPTCKYLQCYEDEECIHEMQEAWSLCLEENLTLVCLDCSSEEESIAGFILLTISKKNDNEVKLKNNKWIKINKVLNYVLKKNDPFPLFGVNEYLSDFGMLVLPNFRKDGVAENLLLASEKLCKDLGIYALIITCSSISSQNLTKKLNYVVLSSDTYGNLRKLNRYEYGIDGIEEHTEKIICMYKLPN